MLIATSAPFPDDDGEDRRRLAEARERSIRAWRAISAQIRIVTFRTRPTAAKTAAAIAPLDPIDLIFELYARGFASLRPGASTRSRVAARIGGLIAPVLRALGIHCSISRAAATVRGVELSALESAVRAALEVLALDHRCAAEVAIFRLAGRSTAEIAGMLRISQSKAETEWARARRSLRGLMKPARPSARRIVAKSIDRLIGTATPFPDLYASDDCADDEGKRLTRTLVDLAHARAVLNTLEQEPLASVAFAEIHCCLMDDLERDASAISDLSQMNPVGARVLWLRMIVDLSREEASEVLGISPRTVSKHWNLGRAMLRRAARGSS